MTGPLRQGSQELAPRSARQSGVFDAVVLAGGTLNPAMSNASHAFDQLEVDAQRDHTPNEEREIARQLASVIRHANLERTTGQIQLPALGAPLGDTFVTLPLDTLHLTSAQDERRLLVEHAMRTQDQDNGPLLSAIRERMDMVGMAMPTVEVRFENLNVDANVSVGDSGMPSVLNYVRDFFVNVLAALRIMDDGTRSFNVLHQASGVLKPGRLTLLLGPPSSGKSTLLKALAGALKDGSNGLHVQGNVTYNREALGCFQVRRTAAYVEQVDNHMAELTVRETLDYAARCQGVGSANELRAELIKREKAAGITPEPVTDAFMRATGLVAGAHSMATELQLRLLGLDVCSDTFVGGSQIRGVSGGQKKRVTTGEMLVGPQRVLMLDEISTGLDSSTTKLITNCLLNLAHEQQATVLVALLQPPPEVYDLFDDILLLSDGRVIFHGARDDVVPFFETLGFALPERKGVADFLQEVTSQKDQAQYWADGKVHDYLPVEAMVKAFEQSPAGLARTADLQSQDTVNVRVNLALADPEGKAEKPSVQPVHHAHGTSAVEGNEVAVSHWASESWPPDALARSKFALSGWDALMANLTRDWILMKRLGFLWSFKTFQTVFVGVMFGTLFIKSKRSTATTADGQLYLAIIFYSIITSMFNGYVEMSIIVQGLRVFFKQRDAQFFQPWTYTLPPVMLRMPWSAVDSLIWSLLVYWTTGMAPDAGRFFIFWAYMFMMSQMALGLFRAIGALARNFDTAQSFGSTALIVLLLNSGFILAKGAIHPWTIWLYWMSPITYCQLALSINEMSHPRWSSVTVFQGQEMTVGDAALLNFGMPRDKYYVWVGMVVMIGYFIVFQILAFTFLTYLDEPEQDMPIFSEEFLAARVANLTGVGIKPKSKVVMTPLTSIKDGVVISQQLHTVEESPKATLPFKPTVVSFHNMGYYVPMPTQDERYAVMRAAGDSDPKLVLLTNITGSFRPGVLTALMGVSGAGKTTLMDVLAGRKTQGTITGDMHVDGYPVDQEKFARVCGYVEQADLHVPRTTVREALAISAILRLPKTDRATVEAFVDEVMNLVELGQQAHALVGLPGQFGLSVEQRKRLTIGVELVANPAVVFADEPTSGLDARAAAIVMRAVRNTVNTGRTVVCTIHQPSIDIFESFDELLLLKRGGFTIFHGAVGKQSSNLISYFQALPGVAACPSDLNPATWMLEVSSFAAEARAGCNFAELYGQSALAKSNDALVTQLKVPAEGSSPLMFGDIYSRDVKTQFLVIMKRNLLSYWRNPGYNAVRLIFSCILGCFLGAIFWGAGSKRGTPTQVLNLMGALFICIGFLGTYNAGGVLPVLAIERPVFYRERASKMYSALPYALAQAMVELPYVAVQSILYAIITYFLIQFELTAIKFLWYLLFTFLTLCFFTFYGCTIVSVCAVPELSLVISAMMYSLWFVFAGFFISEPLMPKWWFWIYWLDPLSYALYGLIGSQLSDLTNDFVTLDDGSLVSVAAFVESTLGFKYSFVGPAAAILAAFIVAFWGIYLLATMKLNFNKR